MTDTNTFLRKTKIVATLGPATDEPGVLEGMVHAGLDVARINFSHGDKEEQRSRVLAVRAAAEKADLVERRVTHDLVSDVHVTAFRVHRFGNL